MTLDATTASLVRRALAEVKTASDRAYSAEDLGAMKARLNEVWFAVHRATETINDAENATRRAALAKLESARTFV